MNCDEALQILLDVNQRDRNEALTHILRNRDCLQRVDQLARAILSNIDYEISCAENRLHLASYYEWQQNQGNTFPLLQDVHAHLDRCPYCQLEYQRLQQSMHELETAPIALQSKTRSFDLSFIDAPLPTVTPTSAIWKAEQQIRRLFEQIQITLSETKASIASLTPQLAPVTFASALRGEDDTQFSVLVLPDLEAKIHIQLDTKPSRNGTALITLRIFDTESNAPISDARVTLRNSGGQLIASSLTDTNGEISFPRIPADRYLIQTQYQNKTWELPISIVRSKTSD